MSGFRRGDFLSDAYAIEEESDEEHVESSDEEVDIILRGSRGQRQNLSRHRKQTRKSSSEDEFEKEMSAELSRTMKDIQSVSTTVSVPMVASASAAVPPTAVSSDSAKTKPSKCHARNVDEIYFGSESDDDEYIKDTRPTLSNDDLLYDPEMDDQDQDWVDNQRRDYLGNQYGHKAKKQKNGEQAAQKVKPLPRSDAVLNCPACMTLLTLDSQRHVKHHHQYRAMFVSNCVIDTSVKLRFPVKDDTKLAGKNKNKKNKKKKNKRNSYDPREQLSNGGDIGRKLCGSASVLVDSTKAAMDASSCTQDEESASSIGERAGSVGESDLSVAKSADAGESAGLVGMSTGTTGEYADTVGESNRPLAGDRDEMYNQVKCVVCNTIVGVYDSDEVYHFFNVLSSHS